MTRIPDANVIHSRLRLRQLRLMLALQGDLEHAGGLVACHSGVDRVEVRSDRILSTMPPST